ncbi:Pectin lyase-like superfamily protein [Rhynchospora pubera]|uniref:Exopolygalacturonase n=1 Tax=Rhynchospora pubera TaxID=906938 RepID=A0AAV8GWH7_9POAL|nr:Pectin lyase-like superfamily protein [Rhynchospora pubera]KAJ4809587.1 Pectin lyase-like superfamily protein [Rhynchospora pubera]
MRQGSIKVSTLLLCVFFCCALNANATSFSVTSYGAKANPSADDTTAFLTTWKAACACSGNVELLIPQGTYYLGQTVFRGPCKFNTITVNLQGTLKASTDLSRFGKGDDWVEFSFFNGLTLTGGGIFDGQGSASWSKNECPTKKNCKVLPTSVKFVSLNNAVVNSVTSIDPKFFHFGVLQCKNFKASNINIKAPDESPNTDGIHIERSTTVSITDSIIGTGDDCISIGQGNTDVLISGIKCGPGHGISVGSLGRYPNEGNVKGLIVKDSSLTGTTNGVRIKTWENSPSYSYVDNMTFQNIKMTNVFNPIIIDQNYCPYYNCDRSAPSKVKISNIFFQGITGSSKSQAVMTVKCSKSAPCQNVIVENVNLQYTGGSNPIALCSSADVKFPGTKPGECTSA